MFCTINNDPCYALHLDVKFVVNLDGKPLHHVKRLNAHLLNPLKIKEKLHFIALNYISNYTFDFHPS